MEKMQTMEQFSHDLTLALEETSLASGIDVRKWTVRRRTCSTGNLPSAPQPTEDSSSSPTDAPKGFTNSMLSDSDDRHDLRLSLKSRNIGNFESDSLNENFSPARFFKPNTRRKRKLKRIAVEYETTPSTPGAASKSVTASPMFPITNLVKKRVLKHTTQENFRTNLFFCGKRKRSHRDRYYDHDRQHSSSVPKQRDLFSQRNFHQEHKTRTKSFSSSGKPCDRILPLNKNIVSKIEKISLQQQKIPEIEKQALAFAPIIMNVNNALGTDYSLHKAIDIPRSTDPMPDIHSLAIGHGTLDSVSDCIAYQYQNRHSYQQEMQKSRNSQVDSAMGTISSQGFSSQTYAYLKHSRKAAANNSNSAMGGRRGKHHRIRTGQVVEQLQFQDPNAMECGSVNEFFSSSSLSSSDSEGVETNESDREGDDELTDWPGNEVMINFASKNDFKHKSGKKLNFPFMRSDNCTGNVEDANLMSSDDVLLLPTDVNISIPSLAKPMPSQTQTRAMRIPGALDPNQPFVQQFRFPLKQMESSSDASSSFLSSGVSQPLEIREIRAGCRRLREERPSFTIMTSVNERLARYLQDARQSQLRLPDIEMHEHENLMHFAKLYSLQMTVDNGCPVLTKTSNTTQSVKIDQPNFGHCFFLSDFKRRCYDGDAGILNMDSIRDSRENDGSGGGGGGGGVGSGCITSGTCSGSGAGSVNDNSTKCYSDEQTDFNSSIKSMATESYGMTS